MAEALGKAELRFDVNAARRETLRPRHGDQRRRRDLGEARGPRRPRGRSTSPTRSSASGATRSVEIFTDVSAEVRTLVVPEGGELPPEEELEAMEAAEKAAEEAEAEAAAEHQAAVEAEVEQFVAEEVTVEPEEEAAEAEEAEAEAVEAEWEEQSSTPTPNLPSFPPPSISFWTAPRTFRSVREFPWEDLGRFWGCRSALMRTSDRYACKMASFACGTRKAHSSNTVESVATNGNPGAVLDDALVPLKVLEAEESVLGAMMLSPGAIALGERDLYADGRDFSRARHADLRRGPPALARASRSTPSCCRGARRAQRARETLWCKFPASHEPASVAARDPRTPTTTPTLSARRRDAARAHPGRRRHRAGRRRPPGRDAELVDKAEQ